MSNVFDLLKGYAQGGSVDPQNATRDFEQVAHAAPQEHLAGGLADAFRSGQTPPFGQMLGTLFSNSNGEQRAGILNHLLTSAGGAGGAGALGGLASMLGSGSTVTPEQAQQVQPEAVQHLAEQAQKNDPSIIDKASSFYAQHPTLVQALGAGSLAMIMSHMSNRS